MNASLKLLTIVGARPQFIKAAPVSKAFAQAGFSECMVDTGQHYDANMSAIFYEQLGIPKPAYQLGVGSGSHGHQTGAAMVALEPIVAQEAPDLMVVYGDTNATLSGALVAAKANIPLVHIEAGLRSFNRAMPEEVNRVVVDHLSRYLFAPTETAAAHLANEGIGQGIQKSVFVVGDVMLDAVNLFLPYAQWPASIATLMPKSYLLLTMHRAETTAQPEKLEALLKAFNTLKMPILFPVHPRTRAMVQRCVEQHRLKHFILCDPLGYLEMLAVTQHASAVLTDSGGLQKEAAFLQVPCLTFREETEWTETISTGWNTLVGLSEERFWAAWQAVQASKDTQKQSIHGLFGHGQASQKMAQTLQHFH